MLSMATDQQRAERWAEQRVISETADTLRARSRQEQAAADHQARIQHDVTLSVFPLDRFKVVRLLDELALAAGRGELPRGVRRSLLEVCDALNAEAES